MYLVFSKLNSCNGALIYYIHFIVANSTNRIANLRMRLFRATITVN